MCSAAFFAEKYDYKVFFSFQRCLQQDSVFFSSFFPSFVPFFYVETASSRCPLVGSRAQARSCIGGRWLFGYCAVKVSQISHDNMKVLFSLPLVQ